MTSGGTMGRWLAALGIAVLGHGGAVAMGVGWAAADRPSASGAPVFAVEIAAAPPAAPATPPPEPPRPEPQPTAAEPPPKPVEAAVPLPKPKPPAPKPKPRPTAPAEAAPGPQRSAAHAEAEAAITAAPVPGANAQAAAARAATWQGELLGHLERHKRYPRAAQWKRREGTVVVAFSLDREGRVIAKRLARASGHADLDDEALALLARAQPLPPPPDGIPGERIELVVPIQFFLKR